MADRAASFPLTDRPWLPVLDAAGRRRLVSLTELFAEAGQLRAIACELPTQSVAILRLLLAVLHRAVDGPPTERAWRDLWRSSELPVVDIQDYLAEYRSRFDLLHPETPFYQVASLHTKKGDILGLEKLIADVPTGAPYLTNRLGPGLERITPAEAAIWVIHCQAYDTSGIKSGAVGDPRVKGGKGYPIGPGACGSLGMVYLEGQTLRETLLLNLVSLDSEYLQRDEERDAPVWERPPHDAAEEDERDRGPYGRLNLYTWQSRRIRLVGDENGITGVLVANGDKLTWENRHTLEPMTGWRRSRNQEKKLKLPLVYLPASHDPARALWRGLANLLPTSTERIGAEGQERLVPALSQWLARLRNNKHIDHGFRVTTRAVGVVYGNQQAVVEQIYHDSVTLPLAAFEADGNVAKAIMESVSVAEAAVMALRRLAEALCRAGGGTGDKSEDPPAMAGVRAAELGYAHLDVLFRRWVGALGPEDDLEAAKAAWQQAVYRCMTSLGADLVSQAGPTAWVGRFCDSDKKDYLSSPQAELHFRRALNRALPLAINSGSTTNTSSEPEEVPV